MSSDESFLREVLAALERAGLDAIVVGSVAAVLHGAPVMTQDLDLLVRDTKKNREKIERLRAELKLSKPVSVSELSRAVTLLGGPVPIDIVFDALPGGLTFESLKSRATKIEIADAAALVASLEDVIASKEAAGRPKDAAQLPMLRETLRVRGALKRHE
jgi:DNA-binding transcriptional ArsR family regulator